MPEGPLGGPRPLGLGPLSEIDFPSTPKIATHTTDMRSAYQIVNSGEIRAPGNSLTNFSLGGMWADTGDISFVIDYNDLKNMSFIPHVYYYIAGVEGSSNRDITEEGVIIDIWDWLPFSAEISFNEKSIPIGLTQGYIVESRYPDTERDKLEEFHSVAQNNNIEKLDSIPDSNFRSELLDMRRIVSEEYDSKMYQDEKPKGEIADSVSEYNKWIMRNNDIDGEGVISRVRKNYNISEVEVWF